MCKNDYGTQESYVRGHGRDYERKNLQGMKKQDEGSDKRLPGKSDNFICHPDDIRQHISTII